MSEDVLEEHELVYIPVPKLNAGSAPIAHMWFILLLTD